MMTDGDRPTIKWAVRYVDKGVRDEVGYIIPKGWWVAGWQEGDDESLASIHVAQHTLGTDAAASLAAVTAHLLNGYEQARAVGDGEAGDV